MKKCGFCQKYSPFGEAPFGKCEAMKDDEGKLRSGYVVHGDEYRPFCKDYVWKEDEACVTSAPAAEKRKK